MYRLSFCALTTVLLGSCIDTGTSICADGRVCPPGLSCDDFHAECITPEQETVCQGVADGEPCAANSADGFCDAQICLTSECGDGFVDPSELCDDGNNESGDGCRADCMSEERCGDGVIEPALSEECDCGDDKLGPGCEQLNSDTAGAECKSDCSAHCGDGETNVAEQCDPNDAFNNSCVAFGRGRGTLGCASNCSFFLEPCGSIDEDVESLFVNSTISDISFAGEIGFMAASGGFNELPRVWQRIGDGWVPDERPNTSGVVLSLHTNPDASVFLLVRPFEQSPLSPEIDVARRINGVWQGPGNKGSTFSDISAGRQVWGRAANDAYVVASNNGAPTASEVGVVLHYDGTSWSRTNMFDLRSVAGDETTVVVGGVGGFACNDDGTWREANHPGETITALVESGGIFYGGTDDGRIVLVDCANLGLTSHPSPDVEPGESIEKLRSPLPGLLLASGTEHVYFFNGQLWNRLETEIQSAGVRAIGARVATDDVYELFVGGRNNSAAAASHTDDAYWTAPITHDLSEVEDIWASEDGVVFIVGDGNIRSFAPSGRSRNFAPALSGDFFRVAGRNKDDVFVVGKQSTVQHFDGTAWTDLNPLLPGTITTGFRGLHLTPSDMFLGGTGVVLRYDGTSFERLLFPSNLQARSIGGSANDLYVLTIDALWHYNGSDWTELVNPQQNLTELHVSDDGTIWVGSLDGQLYNWDGSELVLINNLQGRVNGFSAIASNDIAVVSSGIPLSHHNGLGFSPVDTQLDEVPIRVALTTKAVYMLSATEVRILQRQQSWVAPALP